jgi:hypothetical protein
MEAGRQYFVGCGRESAGQYAEAEIDPIILPPGG